jgi:hypothetical protein
MIQGQVLVQRRYSRQIIYAVNYEIMDALCKSLGGGDLIKQPAPRPSAQAAAAASTPCPVAYAAQSAALWGQSIGNPTAAVTLNNDEGS